MLFNVYLEVKKLHFETQKSKFIPSLCGLRNRSVKNTPTPLGD